jgi:hypothetical protein
MLPADASIRAADVVSSAKASSPKMLNHDVIPEFLLC